MTGEIMSADEAAALIGVSAQTLKKWRREGTGPAWSRLSDGPKGHVRYRRDAIYEWIEAREAQEEGKR